MAPTTRSAQRQSAPSRRQAPTQQRRTAAAAPTRRAAAAAEPEDEGTAFDAAAPDEAAPDDANGNGTGGYESEDDLPTVLDLSQVKPATFEVVPKGTYPGYIDEVIYGLSQAKNLPMLTFICKFDYGEDDDGAPKERTLRYYATLEGDALPRTVAFLNKLKPDLDMAAFEPDNADEIFGGMDVDLRITIRPDREDRKIRRNNIADIIPVEE